MFGFLRAKSENKSLSLIIGSIRSNFALMAKKMDEVNKFAILVVPVRNIKINHFSFKRPRNKRAWREEKTNLSELQGSSSLFASHSSTSLSGFSGTNTPDMLLSTCAFQVKLLLSFALYKSHHQAPYNHAKFCVGVSPS